MKDIIYFECCASLENAGFIGENRSVVCLPLTSSVSLFIQLDWKSKINTFEGRDDGLL